MSNVLSKIYGTNPDCTIECASLEDAGTPEGCNPACLEKMMIPSARQADFRRMYTCVRGELHPMESTGVYVSESDFPGEIVDTVCAADRSHLFC